MSFCEFLSEQILGLFSFVSYRGIQYRVIFECDMSRVYGGGGGGGGDGGDMKNTLGWRALNTGPTLAK